METTQISIGGFREGVSASELVNFLEENVGNVARCRIKSRITPPCSYLVFTGSRSAENQVENAGRVPPHAFVQFKSPSSVKTAIKLVQEEKLCFNGSVLRVREGHERYSRIQRRKVIKPFNFTKARVEVGSLLSDDDFLVAAWMNKQDVSFFHVDPFDGNCRILLTRDQVFRISDLQKDAIIPCDFKIEFEVKDLKSIRTYKERGMIILLLQLLSPPSIYYRTADDDVDVKVRYTLLDDEDPWIRTVDFTDKNAFGRCFCYRILVSTKMGHAVEDCKKYLKRYSLFDDEHEFPDFTLNVRPEGPVPRCWWCFTVPRQESIPFKTLFLLNGLLHKGILNYHSLNEEFYELCSSELGAMALRHMHIYNHQVYDAVGELKQVLKGHKFLNAPALTGDTMEIYRLVVTPTKAYCLPPEIELSNRVLRQYRSVSDRFLRVSFMDENMEIMGSGSLTIASAPIAKEVSSSSPYRTAVFRKVKELLRKGFDLCGRHYSFLAFSANQLRDRSSWFFANGENVTVEEIREWMGRFYNRNVAKHAARMGQCFSSTYSTMDVDDKDILEIEDIERNGYVFSDGIGKISSDLAMEVSQKLQLNMNPPTAFQIRFGGYKGVVTAWAAECGHSYKLALRPSMKKFESDHRMLEIISWSRFLPGYLNRQIITLLSSLGVDGDVFLRLQNEMIYKLGEMLDKVEVAFDVLTSSCTGVLPNTAAIMLNAGFNPEREPLLKDMLAAVRAVQLDDLLRKCRIFVEKGRWLMGCFDETGELEYGQCFIRVSTPALKDCYGKHGSTIQFNTASTVLNGKVIVAKNPCLHPGDIRVLEAVDLPQLHHLVDCLVFPQKGSRPHPNEASGSDLDGDMYFVSWDSRLVPPSGQSWEPMDYNLGEAQELAKDVKEEDITDFFTRHMVSDSLGVICNAHVVRADISEHGALDEDCMELARLAAVAVDFPKSGKVAVLPQHLKPRQYPDFMGKTEAISYRSEKTLGILFREVKRSYGEEIDNWKSHVYSKDITKESIFDDDMEVAGYEDYVEEAWKLKCAYDQQLRGILTQYNVKREGEIVSGYISSISKYATRRRSDVKDKLQHAYRTLRREFRMYFEGEQGSKTSDEVESSKYEAKASAWYRVAYHPIWIRNALQEGKDVSSGYLSHPLLLSFPWICAEYLARIKIRKLWPDADAKTLSMSFTKGLVLKQ